MTQPGTIVSEIFTALDMKNIDIDKVREKIHVIDVNNWKTYASESWFDDKENKCNEILDAFYVD